MRELDTYCLKSESTGESDLTTAYEVVDFRTAELTRDIVTSFICFELGLSEYRQQNWIMCVSHFRKAIQLTSDGPSRVV
jgi:adenylate cyclase